MLAESLGDRTLSIAYWLPDRNTFVDEAGRPVDLPDPGSGRAWTAVERNGVRVAAIVHDAALDTGPELVQAAAAAAALALDNERLKADLRARVEELRVSRVRIVEAADAARRRLERDLHDGAQQQLVSLALDLRLLKARVRDADAEPLGGRAGREARRRARRPARAGPRHPPRGPHRPRPRTGDRGARRPRPRPGRRPRSTCDERLPPPIEAAAYFVVAEALTNVVKYAKRDARARDRPPRGDDVAVAVDDDGVGGARIGAAAACAACRPSRGARRHALGRQPAGRRHPAERADPVRRRRARRRGERPGRRDAAARRPRGIAARPRGATNMRRAALLLCALAVVLGGCGSAAQVREPDLVSNGPASAAAAQPAPRRQADDDAVRIAIVTHGQAASDFWAIVKNGSDAAARQMGITVSTARPTSTASRACASSSTRRSRAGRTGSSCRSRAPALAGAIRRAVRAGIPVVSINSGSGIFRRLGILAHVGQEELPAGAAAGRRMAADGIRDALCVNHEPGNEGPDSRCRGFTRAIRAAGGKARVVPIDLRDAALAQRQIEAALRDPKIDGMLTLSSDGGEAALRALAASGRAGDVELGTFDLSPEVLRAVLAGRLRFAVDQQAYLQGYLPVVLLGELARYGLFAAQGRVIPTGPHFVTRATAAQAIRLSQRGIR